MAAEAEAEAARAEAEATVEAARAGLSPAQVRLRRKRLRLALAAALRSVLREQNIDVYEAFKQMDSDGDGVLSIPELRVGLRASCMAQHTTMSCSTRIFHM